MIDYGLIKSVELTTSDHGMLTLWITIDRVSGETQGFGGRNLYSPGQKHHNAGKYIWRCMEIAGVTSLDKMRGQPIKLWIEDGLIQKIGSFLKDDWFDPIKETWPHD